MFARKNWSILVTLDNFEEIVSDLRLMARKALRGDRNNLLLQTTALVHEAWLRLRVSSLDPELSRSRFLALAAATVRNILVDHIRRENAQKRGGGITRLPVELSEMPDHRNEVDIVELDDALNHLAEHMPRAAEVVALKFYSGMTYDEMSEHLGCSSKTVQNDWRYAKAWLYRRLYLDDDNSR